MARTCHGEQEHRLFPVPPDLPDELERVAAWVEVITGLRLDKQQGRSRSLITRPGSSAASN